MKEREFLFWLKGVVDNELSMDKYINPSWYLISDRIEERLNGLENGNNIQDEQFDISDTLPQSVLFPDKIFKHDDSGHNYI